jgi:PAS domain S-box-containing protein
MSLWKQALILLVSSLLIELVFTALLWRDLTSLSSVLKVRSNAVGTHVAFNKLSEIAQAFEIFLYDTCMISHAAPPAAILQDQLLQGLYCTGRKSDAAKVLEADEKKVDASLAEDWLIIARLKSPDSRIFLPPLSIYFREVDTISRERPDIYESIKDVKNKFYAACRQLDKANLSLRANNKAEALKDGRPALISLRQAVREMRKQSGAQLQRQFEEENAPLGLNRKYIEGITFRLNTILCAGAVLSVLSAAALVFVFSKTSRTRLLRLMNNMNMLTANQALLPVMEGTDDFAGIDRTLAKMASVISSARKKERAIVENSAEMICSIDESGKFVVATSASEKVLGFAEEELRSKNCVDILSAADKDRWINYLEKAKREQKTQPQQTDGPAQSLEPLECWIQRKDGTSICAEWSLNWIGNESTGVSVIRDITERKRLERAKQEFVAMVSQDLREPIAAMQGFLEDTCEANYGKLSDDGLKQAEAAKRSNNRLLSLVDDLLNIENMNLGKMDLTKSECSSNQLIKQSLVAVNALAVRSGIKLESQGENVSFRADSDRLVQVLVNFIGNAIKFSPENSTIVCCVSEVGEQVEFQVIDQGRGIPSHLVDSVFERFKQVTRTDASEKGGAGLGLAICKSIVESHDGSIGACSEEGKGSTFWFRIPK